MDLKEIQEFKVHLVVAKLKNEEDIQRNTLLVQYGSKLDKAVTFTTAAMDHRTILRHITN